MGKLKENSTNNINRQYIQGCDLSYAVCKIGGRWKLIILNKLKDGKLRFSELRNSISGITERMLTLQLRELEKENLVKRTVYAEVPPRVDYELTDIARELIPIWKQLDEWGGKHREMMLALETIEE
ncbi:helix-turn-helix transcriptional regulator [Chryseobacterium sp. D764]|jgi:DNA-binding HxlR family transcriptional regulator|uniref:winged helix-turn-helix transcriptional regulator n=1 Tax=unclassified Chryseobacterium TaxID=2593645 RepID=UPI0015C2A523|nr:MULTISPECIES: helix-turn-helix domain-containing protein [unclassified Chryseobacterium]QXU50136.1 helix-turn-helix transcriptional regulator [Chryseobacterium sp. D764]CAD0218561.1 HxlR family transcriptional regulator [Chryseobacterium sp. JV274]